MNMKQQMKLYLELVREKRKAKECEEE